jgi:uncharacterized protein YbaR (Trm112 family)
VHYDSTCPACGSLGTIMVENLADMPRCPTCGQMLSLTPASGTLDQVPFDADQIVAWMSEPNLTPSGPSTSDTTCLSCGYSGTMEHDPGHGGMICPACQRAWRATIDRLTRAVDCPQCGTAFTLSDPDRGKTTVCPACKSFLGCMWPVEKPGRKLFS